MTTTDSPIKSGYFKLILCAGLLVLAGGCSDDQSDQAADEDTAMSEPAAPATGDSETSAPEPDAGAETGMTADEQAAPGGDTAGTDSAGSERESHTVIARSTAFDPVAVKINPGDSVRWTNMGGHNVHFEKGNIPEGAEPYQSQLGDNVSRTYEKEGIYLYKCDPHFAMGMVGAIIVGEPKNLEQVEQNAKGMYKRALAKAKAEL